MGTMPRHLPLLLTLLLLLQIPLLPAQPAESDPDAASIQLIPSTTAPATTASSSSPSQPATIPAFPEQSDVSTAACPLKPPGDLLPSVSAACAAPGGGLPSRSRCCPTLNAWLLSAYAGSALAARSQLPSSGFDMPALPDDSESCIGGVERAMRDRGVELPRVNATCDVAYCFCGIRLRRPACAGAFVVDSSEGLWVPAGDAVRRTQKDCARRGFSGCTRCLRTLNQLKAKRKQSGGNATRSDNKAAPIHDRDCQLMGVTWLLLKNRTRFLPAATAVLRVLMAADSRGGSDPTSCSISLDDMPLAVGSDQIGSHGGSSTVRSLSTLPLSLAAFVLLATLFHG